jgi:hypothetical protein
MALRRSPGSPPSDFSAQPPGPASQSDFPLPGLQSLTTPSIGWPLALVSLAMALFLSFPPLLTRDRLLVCAGFSLCLFLVVALYASMVS